MKNVGNKLETFRLVHMKTTLLFGPDALTKIRERFPPSKKALVVTGQSSAEKSGALTEAARLLEDMGVEYELVKGIRPNPSLSQCESIVNGSRDAGFDIVIGIGGGSVLDTAKIIAAALGEGVKCSDYVIDGRKPVSPLPFIAINLTHGTGSEIDRYSVVNVEEQKVKKGLITIYPDIGVDDPRYTLTLPRFQTIITTLDAFYHSYESSTGPRANPYVLDLSKSAVDRIARFLPSAVTELENLTARYNLLYASMLAGIAIDYAGTHIVHIFEHGLSGVRPELEHASGLAILGPLLAPYVHRAMPVESASILKLLDPGIKPLESYSERAGRVIEEFQSSVGFDRSLSDYGFDNESIIQAVENAWSVATKYLGDRPYGLTKENIVKLLKNAL